MTATSLYRQLTDHTRTATRDFLVLRDGQTMSYQEFHGYCDRIADALVEHGVVKGERLIVQLPKSAAALAIYVAALRTGSVYVPLNPAYTEAEVGHYVADAEPVLYVGDVAVSCPSLTVQELLDAAAAAPGTSPDSSAIGSDPATMLYTSGTTGRPKGAPATAAGLIRNGWDLAERWQFSDIDTLLHVLPLFHVHGLFVAMHSAMLTGARVILHDRFDVDDVLADLPNASVLMGVPTMYNRLLRSGRLDRPTVSRMRLFTSGSAPLPAPAHDEFTRLTGHTIVERYGLTETQILTSNRIGEEQAGTVGHALPGVDLRIASGQGIPTEPGSPGEVQVRGVTVTARYWRSPAATDEAFTIDGWFRTGDIATMDDTGRVTLLGRDKDVVISGGLNVYPAEIETAILATGAVAEVAVIGVPHDDLGEAVLAVSTGEPAGEFSLDAVASFKRPKAWAVVDELPRNAMGKVQKHVLRDQFADFFD